MLGFQSSLVDIESDIIKMWKWLSKNQNIALFDDISLLTEQMSNISSEIQPNRLHTNISADVLSNKEMTID